MKIGTASGKPTKSFFVRMITRDIALQDCILDLIDNSMDGAWEREGSRPITIDQETDLSAYSIDIKISSNEFVIKDNSGGITLKEAENYAFTFGRDDETDERLAEQHEDFSIGVYGIGMKRAAFKIGRQIKVRSTYRDEDGQHAFEVPINVPKWLKEKQWDFEIRDGKALPEPGVEIVISELNPGVAASFGGKAFENRLRKIIARDYALHFLYGIKINLNGKPVRGWDITFLTGEGFEPFRNAVPLPDFEDQVRVELLCGMAAPPPDEIDPEETIDEEDRFGWYVACNGRFVLSADKTSMSGWGTDGWPSWHGQYNGFLGLVFFSSADTELLPVTTTKRNIDPTSPVFRSVQPRMRELTKEWIRYTNIRKAQLEKAKSLEEKAQPVAIKALKFANSLNLPKLEKPSKPREKVANILYSVPIADALAMGEALGNRLMPYRHIGKKTFEYCFKQLVGRR
jgi:hypothetical protein